MCNYCLQYDCPPGCPNFDFEEATVCTCSECGEDILEGEEYYVVDEDAFCSSCIESKSYPQLMSMFGGELVVASKEEF